MVKKKSNHTEVDYQISILQERINYLNSTMLAQSVAVLTIFGLILSSNLPNPFFDYIKRYLDYFISLEILILSALSIKSRLYFIKIENLRNVDPKSDFLRIRVRDIFKINPYKNK